MATLYDSGYGGDQQGWNGGYDPAEEERRRLREQQQAQAQQTPYQQQAQPTQQGGDKQTQPQAQQPPQQPPQQDTRTFAQRQQAGEARPAPQQMQQMQQMGGQMPRQQWEQGRAQWLASGGQDTPPQQRQQMPAGIDQRAVAADPQGYQRWLQEAQLREQQRPGSTMLGGGGGANPDALAALNSSLDGGAAVGQGVLFNGPMVNSRTLPSQPQFSGDIGAYLSGQLNGVGQNNLPLPTPYTASADLLAQVQRLGNTQLPNAPQYQVDPRLMQQAQQLTQGGGIRPSSGVSAAGVDPISALAGTMPSDNAMDPRAYAARMYEAGLQSAAATSQREAAQRNAQDAARPENRLKAAGLTAVPLQGGGFDVMREVSPGNFQYIQRLTNDYQPMDSNPANYNKAAANGTLATELQKAFAGDTPQSSGRASSAANTFNYNTQPGADRASSWTANQSQFTPAVDSQYEYYVPLGSDTPYRNPNFNASAQAGGSSGAPSGAPSGVSAEGVNPLAAAGGAAQFSGTAPAGPAQVSQASGGNNFDRLMQEAYNTPSGFDNAAVKQLYDQMGQNIDDQYSQQQTALREEMAGRGLSDSSILGGRLADLNVGQRQARTELANQLGIQRAQDYANQRNAVLGLGLQGQGQALQAELGRGNLDVNRQQAATSAELGRGNLDVNRQQAATSAELGRGNLALSGQRLGMEQQGQQFGQQMQGLQFQNQLGQQGFQNQMASADFGLRRSGQQFNQGLAGAQFQNQLGQQGFDNQMSVANLQRGLGNDAYSQRMGWLNALTGYGQQAFNNDMSTAEFNARQGDAQWRRYLDSIALGG